ncbi:hypothetical protein HLB44_14325 [Aquincola sp. S2]|uniref:Uncharacterized protein n=1 Tax=Pseudaquabacterium terrae TaxID=2732868 RepID=A0ABX2EHS0_9BURK|nr:hypothetical protein [Aquabacterium terrae]NRF68166.1 hypothetical protein [Aquabacterium terrae]
MPPPAPLEPDADDSSVAGEEDPGSADDLPSLPPPPPAPAPAKPAAQPPTA